MKRFMTSALITAAALTLAACSDQAAVRPLAPDGAALAKGGHGGGGGGGGVSDPTSTWAIPLADGGLSLKSDGRYSDGTSSVYADGVCGVEGNFFATTQNSNSGDVTLTLNKAKGRNGCGRSVSLVFDDGYTSTSSWFININEIENTTYAIPIGSTVPRVMNIHYSGRCDGLQMGRDSNSDPVQVTRIDGHTWHAVSQPYPNDRAYCTTNGQTYHIQVDVTVMASRDLP
jgi:hypothetical protein